MEHFKQVALLPKEDSGLHNLLVRVHGSHINSTFQRREAVVLVNRDNKQKCIRYIVGAGSMAGITKQTLAIDYDALETLNFKMKKEQGCNIAIRKPRPFEVYLFYMNHPDLSVKLSIRLGVLGALLGFTGLAISVISLI